MSRILFIHRSVGHNLLADGEVYRLLSGKKAVELSDYDQNTDTLTDATGQQQKPGFIFPGHNTRPEDYAQIFSEHVKPAYKPILDAVLSYDVIVIKSCYPNSHITSDTELEDIQRSYQSIITFFAAQPHKQLIILTSPPLRPARTNKQAASRARQLATWLNSTTFDPAIHVFNLFDALATPEGQKQANMLRKDYRRWLPVDSHPNAQASQTVAPLFVKALVASATHQSE